MAENLIIENIVKKLFDEKTKIDNDDTEKLSKLTYFILGFDIYKYLRNRKTIIYYIVLFQNENDNYDDEKFYYLERKKRIDLLILLDTYNILIYLVNYDEIFLNDLN